MASIKPSTPKGTRDFGPEQSAKREYIMDVVKANFKRYGFQQLETPAMENLTTLSGKYGDEGDQLLFKVLNSGDYLSKAPDDKRNSSRDLQPYISEKGLRYDLTVPFARYVVTHQQEITYPFKRFQIQPVWRADRPQKGRYREFYQCDADIIGINTIWNEVELSMLIQDVFAALGLKEISIKINHRSILNAFAAYCGLAGKEMPFCIELDKLDKTGMDSVISQLIVMGADANKVRTVMEFVTMEIPNEQKLTLLKTEFGFDGAFLEEYFKMLSQLDRSYQIDFDLTLARGLTYYTGMVFEVKPTTVSMGSLCGGGRYDNLTGVFGLPNVSGVGISFGLDRIYDVMDELGLFPEELTKNIQVLLIHLDEDCFLHGLSILKKIRNEGIRADIYPESAKVKKQMNYADKLNAVYTLFIGQNEIASGQYNFKEMKTGVEKPLLLNQIVKELKSI